MFKLMAVDDWEHLYYENGVLEPYKKGLQPILQDFDSLSQAEVYATNLVKQYPYMNCLIYQQELLVRIIKDEEYWHWHQEKESKIRKLNSKVNKLFDAFEAVIFILISQILLIVFHLTIHMNLAIQMLSAGVVSIMLWRLVKLYAGDSKIR